MKLYATTTSERASKGQGGNNYLNIIVRDESEQRIAELRLSVRPDNKRATMFFWDNSMNGVGFESELKLKPKGKQQKGDICRHCGKRHNNALCDGGMR